MARRVVWTKRATTNFKRIIIYLEDNWGSKVTRDFVKKSFRVIELIQDYPQLGSLEDREKGIYVFLITTHNRLFYRLSEDQLIILNFFDTRQGTLKTRF
ncbi:MAG TPA: type II toxin-antitoxin system RelE/ParE family toxin [Dyadobacter sp.]|jgi:plasmid stabilization system protein ParE|nr:type II toxin-antitoxin system RelE/ParE family toxin [Dyadobacter sp.]